MELTACIFLAAQAFLSLGKDPNEVLRTREDTYKLLKGAKQQVEQLHKIDEKYGPMLAKLRKDKPTDYTVKRDAMNLKYTHDFMALMTPIQKSDYRKYIRSLRQKYMKEHPSVDGDNVFIWGGANIL